MNKADLTHLANNAINSRKDMDRLFENIYPMVWHFYRIRINDIEDAKDLTQNACIKLVNNLDKFKCEKAGFSTWMYRIIKNLLIDFYRKKTLKFEEIDFNLLEGTESPLKIILNKEAQVKLKELLAGLSNRQKEILEMKYFFNMKNKEISSMLEIKEKTVSSIITRAFEKLKDLLDKDGFKI